MEDNLYLPVEHGCGHTQVQTEGRNPRYAEAMLHNMGGGCSELSSAALYFYNHLVTTGVPEVSEAFHTLALAELRHLEIFGALALRLGTDPRLWCAQQGQRVWWSPEYLHYTRKMGPLLQNALREERAALRKYENQARWIRDCHVAAYLREIIEEEQQHIDLLTRLHIRYGSGIREPQPADKADCYTPIPHPHMRR